MLLASSYSCHILYDGLQAWMNQTVGFLLLGSPEQSGENHVTELTVLNFWIPNLLSCALTYPLVPLMH